MLASALGPRAGEEAQAQSGCVARSLTLQGPGLLRVSELLQPLHLGKAPWAQNVHLRTSRPQMAMWTGHQGFSNPTECNPQSSPPGLCTRCSNQQLRDPRG
ncbi:Hypothetical predicted protein [Marmota monax]|uniref:Uncharacterized protein n=1 Tax=Marmota monax TaxID=9995 RepID=A0A5E4C4T0_MARMO|nr:hypothetical protein GHT09_011519 [Marmota monax]VTJ76290.1 Hypothetical predicted protein [Marmota monax]